MPGPFERHSQHHGHGGHHDGGGREHGHRHRSQGGSMMPSELLWSGARHELTVTGVRRPYDCTYRVANVQPMASDTEQGPLPMYWPISGIVRELQGTVISSDESIIASGSPQAMALIGVTITIADGREDVFKEAAASGNAGPGFTSFASLFGPQGNRICTLERIVKNAYAWQIRFQNRAPATLEDVELTPELVCFIDEDPHGVFRQANRVSVPIGTEIEVYGGHGAPRVIETA